jgi:hypothetical protein
MSGRDHPESSRSAVLLSAECRPLRRSLRPLVWVILEEVALDAVVEDGRLVARTSARQLAERLGIDPGTAATALAVLRQRGLVSSSREKGPAGRFGLSVYDLHPVSGLSVVEPSTAEPFMHSPSTVQPHMAEPTGVPPCVGAPHVESSRLEERAVGQAGAQVVEALMGPLPAACDPGSAEALRGETSPCRPGHSTDSFDRPGSSLHCPGQEALYLGMGTS